MKTPPETTPDLFSRRGGEEGVLEKTHPPFFSGRLERKGDGGPSPRSPLAKAGEKRGFPLSQRGVPGPDKRGDEEIMASLKSRLSEVRQEIGVLSSLLLPANAEQRRLEDLIRDTHRDYPLMSEHARASRKPVFVQLDALAVQWGPTRNERKTYAREERELSKQLDHILKAEKRRQK